MGKVLQAESVGLDMQAMQVDGTHRVAGAM